MVEVAERSDRSHCLSRGDGSGSSDSSNSNEREDEELQRVAREEVMGSTGDGG
jgi:hypothetical protein